MNNHADFGATVANESVRVSNVAPNDFVNGLWLQSYLNDVLQGEFFMPWGPGLQTQFVGQPESHVGSTPRLLVKAAAPREYIRAEIFLNKTDGNVGIKFVSDSAQAISAGVRVDLRPAGFFSGV